MPANSLRFRTVKWYVVIRGNNLSTIFWHLFKNRLSCEYQSLKAQIHLVCFERFYSIGTILLKVCFNKSRIVSDK